MRFWSALFLVITLMAWAPPKEAAAQSGVPPVDDATPVTNRGCWAQRTHLSPAHIDAARALFGISGWVADYSLRTTSVYPSSLMGVMHKSRALVPDALRYEVPLWRFEPLEVSALTEGGAPCPPEPIADLRLSSQISVQGRTTGLHIQTSEPSRCEVAFFGETRRCYREGETDLYAWIGVSALLDPGVYPLTVSVSTPERAASFDLDLTLESGQYGFQFIDPPPALSSLLDPDLMEAELAYLETWRHVRTPYRMWSFPLRAPLDDPLRISAAYGDRRSYGGTFKGYHSGVDYRAVTGTPVLAPAEGRVVMTERLEARGNAILVDHGWGLMTGYWHLSQIDVEVGEQVARGQVLGRVGNTGLSTGAHLHWEVWVNGVSVDGTQWLDRQGLPQDFFNPSEPGSGSGLSRPEAPAAE